MPTTTELTNRYIAEHPSVRDCLKKGVINYSKLARTIARDLAIEKKTSMEAILIACRRNASALGSERTQEERIRSILVHSELEIKNKMLVCIIDKRAYRESVGEVERRIRRGVDTFYAIEGTGVFTLIVSEKHLDTVESMFGRDIIKVTRGLAMIIIKSAKEMERTPGVIAYLYSLFGEHGVNVVETLSCWTDTIVLVSEKDIPVVMGFLRFE